MQAHDTQHAYRQNGASTAALAAQWLVRTAPVGLGTTGRVSGSAAVGSHNLSAKHAHGERCCGQALLTGCQGWQPSAPEQPGHRRRIGVEVANVGSAQLTWALCGVCDR